MPCVEKVNCARGTGNVETSLVIPRRLNASSVGIFSQKISGESDRCALNSPFQRKASCNALEMERAAEGKRMANVKTMGRGRVEEKFYRQYKNSDITLHIL